MEVVRLAHDEARGVREAVPSNPRAPRILCWNCKKLTPFYEDRCEFCGSRFAGSTGGMYATPSLPKVSKEDRDLAEARRTLLQLFEDLQRVHDVSSRRHYDPETREESVTLFQCPACGRFVSEEAASCVCGVRFASESETFACPECGSRVPSRDELCPVCRTRFGAAGSSLAYECPRCGAEVSADAARCACGARFES